MSNIYIGTSLGSNGDGNYIDVTVTNTSGVAWTNPIIGVIAKVGGVTASYYTAEQTPATLGTGSSVDIGPIGIGTHVFIGGTGTTADYVHAGVAFVGTASAY